MKLTLLLLSTSFLLSFASYSQTTSTFRANYNQALFDLSGNAVESLTSDRYIFAGTNTSFVPIYGTITEVDNTGALIWSRRYSDASIGFQLWDIKKDATLNEYYVCGGSESNAAVFMRVDASGNVVVSKKFAISEADGAYLNRVQKTSDGGYIAVGYVTGYDPDGAGSEIDFAPISYTDADGNPQTDQISSPLIVKLDANGNHLWHKVFRYYTNAAKDPATHRIYNDAAFNDVIETADGYVAVGQYDVNQHRSATNSDGDDATPTDALILKTDFTGTIVYHKQYDAVSSSTSQSSKTLSAISKTSGGTPIAAGLEGSKEWIIKFAGSGGWSPTFSRVFTFPGFGAVAEPSQIYEANGGTDLITMGTYVNPLAFTFANYLHRSNSGATGNIWTRSYTFSLAAILPRGSQVSDNGNLLLSMTLGGTNYDYHLIKTDPDGNTPLTGCAPTNLTPTAGAGPSTTADPFYNFWSGTVGSQTLAVAVATITPTSSIQCSFVPCTSPAAPTATVASQPDCSASTGSVTLSGLPTSGTWTVTGTPSGTATGNTSSTTISGLAPGSYTFTVSLSGCTSTASNAVTINAGPTVPSSPLIGTISQPTCTVGTGSIQLTGLPSTGTWTITGTPSGSASGSGTTTVLSSLTPGTYTFTVNNGTCTSTASLNAVIDAAPTTPTAPVLGTIIQPTCSAPTGSVALSGLPNTGTWTVTASNGSTITGSITTATFGGLSPGTYTFTVTNASGCTSASSTTSATINAAPGTPTAPVIGTITQPTCTVSTGSVQLSGLPNTGTWIITASPGGSTITGSGTTGTVSGLNPNTYTFSVADNNGCASVASLDATINPAPSVPTAPIVGTVTDPDCATPTGSVEISGLPSTGTWTITASPSGATTTGTSTTNTFSGLNPGTYSFTVINSDGCTSSASTTTATITAAPSTPSTPVTGIVTQPSCSNPNGSIQLTNLPTGAWTVTENPGGATFTGTTTTTVITVSSPGTYTYSVTNQAGCNSAASSPGVTINPAPSVPSSPIIGAVTNPTCTTASNVELSGLPSTGTWTITASPGGSTITGSGTTANFGSLPSGNYTFIVTNSSGCSSTASTTTATINAAPNGPLVTISSQTDVTCNGDTDGSASLNSTGGSVPYTYSWSGGAGNSASVTSLAPGTYIATVTDNSGCTTTISVTIDEPSIISPNANVTNIDCVTGNGGNITTSASGGTGTYSYLWTPSGAASSSLNSVDPGTYTVTVSDANGCSASQTTTVSTSGALAVSATPNYTEITAGQSVSIQTTGGSTYSWTPPTDLSCTDCPDPVASPSNSTEYIVIATDENGCVGQDTVFIKVNIECGEYFVPTAFSPNETGPNENNTLRVFGVPGCIAELDFSVYNRWGEVVFQTTDITKSWDGKYKDKLMNSGIFVYKLYVKLTDGTIIEQSGNTTLVR